MPLPPRTSPRWRRRDYRRAGLYFVTICTGGRAEAFGEVPAGRMALSPLGQIAADEWNRTLAMRTELLADVFVVMPNHVHVLFAILECEDGAGPRHIDLERPP
jgi:REP element-mobilizing transposase RayT